MDKTESKVEGICIVRKELENIEVFQQVVETLLTVAIEPERK